MSKLKPLAQILAGWDGLPRPKDGDIYEHYKGGRYTIVTTGFLENSEEPCVVYRSLAKDIVWVRTAEDFLEEVEHEGRRRPRFIKI